MSSQTRPSFPANEALRAELRRLRAAGAWTNSRIATAIGYTTRVVSDYLNDAGNKYDGDVAAVERKITEWMRDLQLHLDSRVPLIACEVAEQIELAVEEIRTAKRIGVIIGAPGIGKTCGIARYCQSHELAIAFTTRSWHRNVNSLSNCLLAAANMTQSKRGLQAFGAFVERTRGMTRPILVDDAHKLTRGAIQLLYDYRDDTGAPVALFGDERLLVKCRDDAQRLRRTGIVTHLQIRNPGPLIEHHLRSFIGGDDLSGDEAAELRKLSRRIVAEAGHFGSLQMELALAVRLKKGKPDWSWPEAVRKAHKKLIRDYDFNGGAG